MSDLHGRIDRYQKLFKAVERERPHYLFLGGDLLPHGMLMHASINPLHRDFINGFLRHELMKLRDKLGDSYPTIFLILGNDDDRIEEAAILSVATEGLWEYIHGRRMVAGKYQIYGYSYIPPSPFLNKDWERYDVSRYVDPGCISPEEGRLTVPVSERELRYSTIKEDLEKLTADEDLSRAIFLFHCPPYKSGLDRAELDGKMIDYVPLDVHVGSIAIKRFIEQRQPYLTLHGHVHESARLTGKWQENIGGTRCISAAHDGDELKLIRFTLGKPDGCSRELL